MFRLARPGRMAALVAPAVTAAALSLGAVTAAGQPPVPAVRPPVTLATLSWPPYTGASLPRGGAVTDVVRAAFDAMGREVTVKFRPWNRSVALAKAGHNRVAGYYPGYHCDHDPEAGFLRSYSIGMRSLGLAKRANAAFGWETLSDLEGFRVGTVVGYANTQRFDRKVAAEELWTIESPSDRRNLRKLIAGRLDYAVIDKHVMRYMLRTDPALRKHRGSVTMDDKLLGRMPLFVCFRNNPHGEALQAAFNEGLSRLHPKAILSRYLRHTVPMLTVQPPCTSGDCSEVSGR